ncbi:MAG: Gfo/Idh/MocA family oxidoreductase [Minicystis sp.]
MKVRVALVGCGGWGRNILRVLVESPRAYVVAVADPHPQRQAFASGLAPQAAIVPSLDEALAAQPDAVVIATPPHTHAALAFTALAAGADVFVEKPLATRAADAERLAAKAAALGRVAMVGHLLRYHPAVVRLIEIAASGALGPLRRFEASRLSAAGDRSASAIWTLGPHDFSVLHALDPSPMRAPSVRCGPSGDPVLIEAQLTSGLDISIALSRVAPAKERWFRIVGAGAAATFDDVRAPDRVIVGAREHAVAWEEPLAVEIDHFLRCVLDRARPLTSFDDGRLVVQALAAAEESLSAAPDRFHAADPTL